MPTIRMIYNANGGLLQGALDSLHKIFSPSTYDCRLCDVTYGLVGMKQDWAQTIAALPHPVTFHHRDDWARDFPNANIPLPAILLDEDSAFTPLVSAEDFAAIKDLAGLQSLLQARVAALPARPST